MEVSQDNLFMNTLSLQLSRHRQRQNYLDAAESSIRELITFQ